MIFIMIPGIPGDVRVKGFDTPEKPYFAAESMSFGVERELADSAKGGTEDINLGIGELQEVSISKSMDKSSTMLARRAISGSSCQTAEIKFVEAVDDGKGRKNVVYLWMKLDNCFIKSWNISGDSDDRPTEEITLWYNKIAFNYWPSATGGIDSYQACNEVGWNQVKAAPWPPDQHGIIAQGEPEMHDATGV